MSAMPHDLKRAARVAVPLLALVGTVASAVPAYTLQVTPRATGRYTVDIAIKTNLPPGAVLSISLGLAGQKPNDVFIGTDFVRATVQNGRAHAVIDGEKIAMPHGSKLPAGTYDVEVNFYPLWRENRALGLAQGLESVTRVKLGASGGSATSAQKKAAARKWVMLHVDMGDSWAKTNLVGRFGKYVEIPLAAGHGNPHVLAMYYFPGIDMTFMVNKLKGTIEVWRMGKASY